RERYPIVLSRDLAAAKRWVKSNARANERFGLLGSSKAMTTQTARDRSAPRRRSHPLLPRGTGRRAIQLLPRRLRDGVSGAGSRTGLGLRGGGRRPPPG